MKKELYLSLFLIFIAYNFSLAQYANCTPDYSVEDPEGVGVRDPIDLPVAFTGEYYSTVFTIIAPAKATTWGFINTNITKIQITDLVNLPSGLNQDSNAGNDDGFLYGGEYYCYTLNGTPNAAPGIHTIVVYANAWIRVLFEVQAPGNPQNGGKIYFTLCNELNLDLGANRSITTDDEITLNANQNNNYHTYAWSNGCTDPSCTFSGEELGIGTHEISVTVLDTVGTTGYYEGRETRCYKSDNVFITVTDGNSIKTNYGDDISVFPNPTKDLLHIKQIVPKNISIEVFSLSGDIIYKTNTAETLHTINLSHLSKGVYFLKLTGRDFSKISKLFVE